MLQTIFKLLYKPILKQASQTAWLQTSHKCCWSYSGNVQLKPRAVSHLKVRQAPN